MREQSEFIADAIEALDEGFVIFDDNATMVYCNARYRDMYCPIGQEWKPGTNLEQIARDTATHCLGVCGDENVDQWVQDRLSMHRSNPEPFEQNLSNGLCLRVSETNLTNGWVVGTRTDITTLKEQSRELQEHDARASRLVEELLESNADLERFAHVASHDLQAPVRRILAFADLLKADFHDQIDDTAQGYLAGIQRSAGRMNDLIKDLWKTQKSAPLVPSPFGSKREIPFLRFSITWTTQYRHPGPGSPVIPCLFFTVTR